MSEIKCCPFCGGNELVVKEIYDDRFCVICNAKKGGCGSAGGIRKTEKQAIETWNTRKPMERIIERLKKKIQASDTKFDNITEMNAYDDGMDDAIEIVKEEGGIE